EKSDLLHWLKYFLIGVENTATNAVQTLSKVIRLKHELEDIIQQQFGRRSTSALKLLTHLFKDPVITAKKAEEVCGLSKKAANELVNIFENNSWLRKIGNSERYRTFI